MTRVLVTGGGGFLGSHLVERLESDGHEVFSARRADYDLTLPEETARLFDDAAPELVFHLAAEVGGIGANRSNPGRYWYANLAMGLNILEQARVHETRKLVVYGNGLLVSEVRTGSVQRNGAVGRVSGGDERALRGGEEGRPRRWPGLPGAVRAERGVPAAHEPLRATGQLRSGDLARDSRR